MQRTPRHIVDIAIAYENRQQAKKKILAMLEKELKDARDYLDHDVIPGLKLAINKVSRIDER